MRTLLSPAALFALVCGLAACSGSTKEDTFEEGALERRGSGQHATAHASVDEGSFPMLAGEPVHSLPGFGCRHYMKLDLANGRDGAVATFEAALDSDDPSDMDNGGCGGEELPHATGKRYVLHEVSKDDCGNRVLEGTVVWTDSGRVTRTLRIRDHRKAHCGDRPARIVLEESRALDGESHPVETYYSVDPR